MTLLTNKTGRAIKALPAFLDFANSLPGVVATHPDADRFHGACLPQSITR